MLYNVFIVGQSGNIKISQKTYEIQNKIFGNYKISIQTISAPQREQVSVKQKAQKC